MRYTKVSKKLDKRYKIYRNTNEYTFYKHIIGKHFEKVDRDDVNSHGEFYVRIFPSKYLLKLEGKISPIILYLI